MDGELLHPIQREGGPAPAGAVVIERNGIHQRQVARGKDADGVVVIVQGDADLLQIIAALNSPGRLSGGLDGRQQERDQHGVDDLERTLPQPVLARASGAGSSTPESEGDQAGRPRRGGL